MNLLLFYEVSLFFFCIIISHPKRQRFATMNKNPLQVLHNWKEKLFPAYTFNRRSWGAVFHVPCFHKWNVECTSCCSRTQVERSRCPQQRDTMGCVVRVQRGILDEEFLIYCGRQILITKPEYVWAWFLCLFDKFWISASNFFQQN